MAVQLTPSHSSDPNVDPASEYALELRRALLDETTCRLRTPDPAPGEKGTVHDFILDTAPLLSAPGFLALARILSIWLNRDGDRGVVITNTRNPSESRTTIDGKNVSLSVIETAIRQALKGEEPPG